MNLLIRLIPPPLVRLFARPYVAGDSLEAALVVAERLLAERGLCTTLDLLAEDIEAPAMVQRNLDTYLQMVDAVADAARFPDPATRPSLSLKPSSYTTAPLDDGGDAEGAREALFRIADHAASAQVPLTIDMEGRAWTDFTLDVLEDLDRSGYRDVGCVLQTRLHRTEADLDRLPPACRVRLVIGIYREPEEVAITDKPRMKQRLLDYGERLLRAGHYVELATHDERIVRAFVGEVVPRVGADPSRYEIQMLYGVPRNKLLQELVGAGIRARLYVPFALSWPQAIRYLRRRLDEYPAMIWLVCKNMLLRR